MARDDIRLNYADTLPQPEWGTGADGRAVKIDADERLPALYAEWQADACRHSRTCTVKRDDSLGRPQYFEFCEDCGLKLSTAIAHSQVRQVSEHTADYLEALNQSYDRDRRASRDRLANDAAERCQSGNREAYDDYLRSDAWKRRAAKILNRAQGICEGCLTNPASEVHHLTYAHLGREFAFELVALCRACHARIHESA